MAGTLLLVNPRGRHRRRRNRMPAALARYWATHRRNPHRRRRNAAHHRRRRNVMTPMLASKYLTNRRRHYRRNPVYRRHHRRRNPLTMTGFMALLRDAGMASVGALAFDYLFGFVNTNLPATLQRKPGSIGVGDAVKVLFNVMLGTFGGRMGRIGPFMRSAAEGSMTVHFYQLISQNLPTTVQAGLAGNLGWYQPAPVIRGTQWVTPNRGKLVRQAPLLSAFTRGSPSLNAVPAMVPHYPTVVGFGMGSHGIPIR